MQKSNLILIILFSAVILIRYGIFYAVSNLREVRAEHKNLNLERSSVQASINSLIEQNVQLKNLISADKFQENPGHVEIFSYVQNIMQNNNLNIISSGQENLVMTFKISGNYYAFINMLANLRNMPYAVKINNLRIRKNEISPADLVDVNITFENL